MLGLLVTGCASTGYKKANHTADYLEATADRINKGVEQMDSAIGTLTTLVENPNADLTLQFKNFSTAVKNLESVTQDVGARAAKIQELGIDYFQKWDEQLTLIKNETIRNNSAERKAAVMKKFDAIRASYEETRTVFNPLLADLRDIRTAMSTDLTPAGVEAFRSSMTKVNTEAAKVRKTLDDLTLEFRNLGKSLETPTPPPAEKTSTASK